MLRKIIFGFLVSNFLLFDCDPMAPLQTNLEQLKDSLCKLKNKLGTLNAKLGELNKKLVSTRPNTAVKGPVATKNIVIDGKKYCTCEYWKVSILEAYVKNNCKPFDGVKPAFNVIPRMGQHLSAIVNDQMKDPQYNGAVFQLAANDNVPYVWTGGGSHAGYMVKATELGNIIRKHSSYNNCKNLNSLFDDPALPKSNSSRTEGCAALGTADASPEDLNNIFIAIHSGLDVHKMPGQAVNVVFTAAYDSPKLPNDKIRMKNCLKAGYDGILLSAIKLGVSKIVLTIIGGHVFEGYPPYIIDAIENAIREYAVKYNLNVTLYLDDSQFSWQGKTNLQKECDQRLIDLAKEINGA